MGSTCADMPPRPGERDAVLLLLRMRAVGRGGWWAGLCWFLRADWRLRSPLSMSAGSAFGGMPDLSFGWIDLNFMTAPAFFGTLDLGFILLILTVSSAFPGVVSPRTCGACHALSVSVFVAY